VTLNSYVETMAKVKALGGDDFRKWVLISVDPSQGNYW
jgi:hypothetical protein